MKATQWLTALAISVSITAQAQITDMAAAKNSAFLAAKRMDEAMVNRHYDDFVAYMHPKVLATTEGGAAGMSIQIGQQVKSIEESGNYITAIYPRMPETVIENNGEWQCTMGQTMEYRLPDGKIKARTTLVGMSPDKGNTWYFIDAAGRTLKDMQTIFPELSNSLVIPPAPQPEYVPDNPTPAPAPKAAPAPPAPPKAPAPPKK